MRPGTYYSGYVGWAVENGIVVGDGKGHFMPYDKVTGAKTVARADLAQRLLVFINGGEKRKDTSVTMPVRAYVTSTGRAGCSADETEAEHAAHSSQGWIMGYSDRGVYTFMGIQYGTAKRFENPKPANVYGRDGVENLYSEDMSLPTLAMVRGAACPQAKTNTVCQDGFGFAQYMPPPARICMVSSPSA